MAWWNDISMWSSQASESSDIWKLGGRDITEGVADFNKAFGAGGWRDRMHEGSIDWLGDHDWDKSMSGGAFYRDRLGGSNFDKAWGAGAWGERFGIGHQGGGGGDGEDDEISSSGLDTPTVDDTVNLDPGNTQTTAPMFTDVSMSASRSTARSALGSRGYDTGTSKGRDINERRNKRMGTALTRSMA